MVVGLLKCRWPLLLLLLLTIHVTGASRHVDLQHNKHVESGGWEGSFPVPTVQNVYKAWKPVNSGHPFRDATLFYAPPTLERVKVLREDEGGRRRRLDHGRSGEFAFETTPNVVIHADTGAKVADSGYSVYGSPDINYSELYEADATKMPTHDQPLPEARSSPYDAFSSRFQERAHRGHAPGHALGHHGSSKGRGHRGGGFQYMEPPNRAPDVDRLLLAPSIADAKEPDERAAVIYSFKHGDSRRAVGVVYGNDKGKRVDQGSKPYRSISLAQNQRPPTLPPRIHEPDHQTLVSGSLNHVHHGHHGAVMSAQRQVRKGPQVRSSKSSKSISTSSPFPLGTPPSLGLGSEVRRSSTPTRLEGVLGPRPPPRPQPTRLFFPDEDHDLRPRALRRVPPRVQQVFKTVRDMDYSQPEVVMRVKESGELYLPEEKEITQPQWTPSNAHFKSQADLSVDDSHKELVVFTKNDQHKTVQSKVDGKSNEELYQLCLKEVPHYLKHRLCHHLLAKSEEKPQKLQPDEKPQKPQHEGESQKPQHENELRPSNEDVQESNTQLSPQLKEEEKSNFEPKSQENEDESHSNPKSESLATVEGVMKKESEERLKLLQSKVESTKSPTVRIISPRPTVISTLSRVKVYGAKKSWSESPGTRTSGTPSTPGPKSTSKSVLRPLEDAISTTRAPTTSNRRSTTPPPRRSTTPPTRALSSPTTPSTSASRTTTPRRTPTPTAGSTRTTTTPSSRPTSPARRRPRPSPFLLGLTKFLTQRFLAPKSSASASSSTKTTT